jgi:hypothetical protein
MTDRGEHRRKSDRQSDGPEVWACVLVGADGIETWVCETEDIAFGELAAACRRSWADALDFDRRTARAVDQKPLPTDPPSEDRATVEAYFRAMRRALPAEHYRIAPLAVIGDAEGGCFG